MRPEAYAPHLVARRRRPWWMVALAHLRAALESIGAIPAFVVYAIQSDHRDAQHMRVLWLIFAIAVLAIVVIQALR